MSFLQNHKLIQRGGLEPETVFALSRMTVKPSIEDAFNYDEWIKEIKEGHSLALGVNSLAPTFRLLQTSACHHPQVALLNWVGGGFDGYVSLSGGTPGTAGGSLDHIPYKATTSLANTYIFITSNLMLDNLRLNCTFGHYNYVDLAAGQAWGSGQNNGTWNLALNRTATPTILARINCTNTTQVTQAAGSAVGIVATKRTGNTLSIWVNTTLRASATVNDNGVIAPTSSGIGIHGFVRNGDVVGNTNLCYESCHFYGTFSIDLAVMKSAIENYLAKYP